MPGLFDIIQPHGNGALRSLISPSEATLAAFGVHFKDPHVVRSDGRAEAANSELAEPRFHAMATRLFMQASQRKRGREEIGEVCLT